MQKPVTAGKAGTAFGFPTIGPEILPVSLGAGEELYPGRMGWVQDCSGLPPAEGRGGTPLLPTILPRFYLEHSWLCATYYKLKTEQNKSLFCVNSWGGCAEPS